GCAKKAWSADGGMPDGAGLGVFANADVAKGTVVEVCPTLGFTRKSISAADSTSSAVEGTRLEDYVYEFPGECSHLNDDRMLYLPLGFGSLYNHSDKPNLRYNVERTIDGRHVVMVMKATEDIPAGSELCVSYGDQWWWERMQKPVSGYSTHMFRKSIMEKARDGA
ncbi:hypothetical protein FOZ62_028910, partial [Perkinsus olseni]